MSRNPNYERNLAIIANEARERGIPTADFMRFAYLETGGTFNDQASRGPNGAKGLFQFVPDTARHYGIAGRELDPVANTDAAARLYLDNRRSLVSAHARDGLAYLSGNTQPDGLDMYMAHQQGARGYRDIQAAVAGGELSDVRRDRMMNNISHRDVERVTGVRHADLAGLPDSQFAKVFVDYWDTKYERIQVSDRGIQLGPLPSRDGGQPAATAAPQSRGGSASGVVLNAPYELSIKYDANTYGFGTKDVTSGKVDCSGWVGTLIRDSMHEINKEAGREVFAAKDRMGLHNLGEGNSAGHLVEKAQKASGVLLTGGQVTAANLKEGMIIGEDNGKKGWDAGRYKGIDHITMVVRDPKSGELMISQSDSSRGVNLMPVDKYLAGKNAGGTELFATDPLVKGRDLLQSQGKVQAPHQAASDGVINQHDSKSAVNHVQQMLNKLGYTGPDGQPFEAKLGAYGPKTEHAVKQFQGAHGLAASGQVDETTLKALKHAQEHPLVTERNHPANALFDVLKDRLPKGTPTSAVANVTLQAMENGIPTVCKLGQVGVQGNDVLVMSTIPGFKARVDLQAPTPTLEAMSEHMNRQAVQQQQAEAASKSNQPSQPSPDQNR